MKSAIVKVVFDRKKTATKKAAKVRKEGSVQIEVYYNRQRKWLTTGVRVHLDEWKGISPNYIYNRADATSLNAVITRQVQEVWDIITRLGDGFSLELLELGKEEEVSLTFLEFVEDRIRERRMAESTRKQHKVLYDMLVDYGKIVQFDDLTSVKIVKFNDWVMKRKNKNGQPITQTSVYSVHKRLKVYVKDAMVRGYVQKNPYFGVNIARGKSRERLFLTDEEMERLRTAEMPTQSLERVRDLAVFQMYTGLSFADLAKFNFKKAEKKDGHWLIRDARQKTGEPFMLVLLSPAVEILEKYKFVLPKMSMQQYNMRLKMVVDAANIDKQLSSHCLRHTFAMYALNHGLSMEVVARILGHTKLATTQIYAKMQSKTVEAAMMQLEEKLPHLHRQERRN